MRQQNVTTTLKEDHTICFYLSEILLQPPTCMFSLFCPLAFTVFHCVPCCEYRVGSFTEALCVHPSMLLHREVGGHLFNWLRLPPMLWQSKCYLQPHCSGCTLTLSTMRAENWKWKSGPVLQEIRGAATRCAECPQIWLCYSVSRSSGNFKESEFSLLQLLSVCFNNHDDFTMFRLKALPVGWARVPYKGSIKALFISLCEFEIATKNGRMLPFPPLAETMLPVTAVDAVVKYTVGQNPWPQLQWDWNSQMCTQEKKMVLN